MTTFLSTIAPSFFIILGRRAREKVVFTISWIPLSRQFSFFFPSATVECNGEVFLVVTCFPHFMHFFHGLSKAKVITQHWKTIGMKE